MMKWTIERARQRGAHVMQLTTHKSRLDAHRFYERLGFEASHVGMKLSL
jgi:GNAT superfamily N-acetyltransferase